MMCISVLGTSNQLKHKTVCSLQRYMFIKHDENVKKTKNKTEKQNIFFSILKRTPNMLSSLSNTANTGPHKTEKQNRCFDFEKYPPKRALVLIARGPTLVFVLLINRLRLERSETRSTSTSSRFGCREAGGKRSTGKCMTTQWTGWRRFWCTRYIQTNRTRGIETLPYTAAVQLTRFKTLLVATHSIVQYVELSLDGTIVVV